MTIQSRASELARDAAGEVVLSESRGDAVRGLREKAGLTQRELAGLLDTTRERVSRVENGHVPPSADFVAELARTMALAEMVRDMRVRDGVDSRTLRRAANLLGLEEGDVDLLVIRGLSSLDRKKEGLIEELE